MGAGWATGPQVPQLKDHVSPGVFFSPLEFGNMQKINQPDVVCEDPEETVALASCSEHVSPLILGGGGSWRSWPLSSMPTLRLSPARRV